MPTRPTIPMPQADMKKLRTRKSKVLTLLRMVVAGYKPSLDKEGYDHGLCELLVTQARWDMVGLGGQRAKAMFSGYEYYSGSVAFPIDMSDCGVTPGNAYSDLPLYGDGEYASRRRAFAAHLITYITKHGLDYTPPVEE